MSSHAVSPVDKKALEKRVLRKLNIRILLFLLSAYLIAYLDRVSAGFAALQMNQDLGLTAAMFGFGGTLFYIAYILFEIPSNVLMEKAGPRIWIARIMITWGMVGIAAAFVTGSTGFYVTRFLLGVAEAGFFPGALYYLSQWYPMSHKSRVMAIFSLGVPLSIFLGAPVSGVLLEMTGTLGLRGWQWLFVVESIPAILLGLVALGLLADHPRDAKWLTSEERAWLEANLAQENSTKKMGEHLSLVQILTNKYVLMFGLIYAGASSTSNSLALWIPQILKSFNLSNLETSLVATIPYGLASAAMVIWGSRADKTGERIWSTAVPLGMVAVALAATNLTSSLWVTVALLSVALIGNYSTKGPFWALVSSHLPSSAAAAGFAAINTLAHIGTSITTLLIGVIRDKTGSFPMALLCLVALTTAGTLTVFIVGRHQRRPSPIDATVQPT